jgi:hypothetical protein
MTIAADMPDNQPLATLPAHHLTQALHETERLHRWRS